MKFTAGVGVALAILLIAGTVGSAGVITIGAGDFADPVVLDFEGLSVGPISSVDAYFTGVGLSSVLVTGGGGGSGNYGNGTDGQGLASVGDTLGIVAPNSTFDSGIPTFTLNFAGPRDRIGFQIVDQVNMTVDMEFYRGATLVESHSFAEGSGFPNTMRYFRTTSPFDSFVITSSDGVVGNGDWGLDNITFETAAIPEPGTLALLGLGGLGLAAAARRRRRS